MEHTALEEVLRRVDVADPVDEKREETPPLRDRRIHHGLVEGDAGTMTGRDVLLGLDGAIHDAKVVEDSRDAGVTPGEAVGQIGPLPRGSQRFFDATRRIAAHVGSRE
jgi:hypothetical protein